MKQEGLVLNFIESEAIMENNMVKTLRDFVEYETISIPNEEALLLNLKRKSQITIFPNILMINL
jgi:hypothetical protein